MMEERIIVAGFGGQGVLMLGKLLAQAALLEGREVTWLPSYGPEMRGGTANCNVIMMNLPSLDRFEPAVVPGGRLLLNSSLIPRGSARSDLEVLAVPATALAVAQGSPKVANVVMLGAFIARSGAVGRDSVAAALTQALGPSKQHLLGINLNALEAGMKIAGKECVA